MIRVSAATLNMYGNPAPRTVLVQRRRARANCEAVKANAAPFDYFAPTERWPYGYGLAIANAFPGDHVSLPMYGPRSGMSEGAVLDADTWDVTGDILRGLHGTVAVGTGRNRKVISDPRQAVGKRATHKRTRIPVMFITYHLCPLGAWAGQEGIEKAAAARHEAMGNLEDLLRVGGAAAVLLGDKNTPQRLLPVRVTRANGILATARQAGAGATESGYFVDGGSHRWTGVTASHFPAPFIDHHAGGLRISATLESR